MPNESISVYLTAVDGMSSIMTTIADKTKALDKESQELQQTYEALQAANKTLIERKTELYSQLKKVNEEVKEAQKNHKALNDEASSDALNKATEKQQALKNQIAATTQALQENQKMYKENIETIRKGEMEVQGTGLGDIATGLFAGQVGQMLSSSLGGLGQSMLTSAIGTPGASLISDALSSTISGIAAGSVLGVPGMVVGGLVGTASGLVSGGTKIFEAKDDAFKDYYGGLYGDVSGRSGEMTSAGSALSSAREADLKSFSTLLDGDVQSAERFQAALIEIGRTPPFSYDSVAELSKSMIGLGLSTDDVTDRISALGEAAAALDLSESGVATIASTLESIQLSGTLESRVLKTLSKQGINVYEALADEFNMAETDVAEKLGELDVNRAVKAIYDYMGNNFAGASAGLTDTYSGASGILASYKEDAENAGGAAYNELRTSGINDEIAAYKGELGDAIGEINAIMGENQARKENLQDQYMREVLDAVLNGNQGSLWTTFDEKQQQTLTEMSEQYASLMERYQSGDTDAGAELESLYEQAQTLGQAYFDNSNEVQRLNDIEQAEIEAIRDAVGGLENAYTALYNLNQTMSKGLVATIKFNTGAVGITAEGGTWDVDPNTLADSAEDGPSVWDVNPDSHAFGLSRVPYDGYQALLHEGERVLTASEARAQDAGQSGTAPLQITVSGNYFTGTPEEMADQLAEIIVRKIAQAATAAAPK